MTSRRISFILQMYPENVESEKTSETSTSDPVNSVEPGEAGEAQSLNNQDQQDKKSIPTASANQFSTEDSKKITNIQRIIRGISGRKKANNVKKCNNEVEFFYKNIGICEKLLKKDQVSDMIKQVEKVKLFNVDESKEVVSESEIPFTITIKRETINLELQFLYFLEGLKFTNEIKKQAITTSGGPLPDNIELEISDSTIINNKFNLKISNFDTNIDHEVGLRFTYNDIYKKEKELYVNLRLTAQQDATPTEDSTKLDIDEEVKNGGIIDFSDYFKDFQGAISAPLPTDEGEATEERCKTIEFFRNSIKECKKILSEEDFKKMMIDKDFEEAIGAPLPDDADDADETEEAAAAKAAAVAAAAAAAAAEAEANDALKKIQNCLLLDFYSKNKEDCDKILSEEQRQAMGEELKSKTNATIQLQAFARGKSTRKKEKEKATAKAIAETAETEATQEDHDRYCQMEKDDNGKVIGVLKEKQSDFKEHKYNGLQYRKHEDCWSFHPNNPNLKKKYRKLPKKIIKLNLNKL